MSLLRLAPEILASIDGLEGDEGCRRLTERRLREIVRLEDHQEQQARLRGLVGDALGT